ncbi:MAG: hypothetical protein K9N35_05465 [Candidatus Marinimicrobia bacterium]|nr:hypothetical protein [Candidatus Neomarinimicrobiota bacterium]
MESLKQTLFVRHILFVALFLFQSLFAAFEFPGVNWAGASANVSVIGDSHLDRYAQNPALMSMTTKSQVSVQYGRPFVNLELNSTSLKILHHFKSLSLEANIDYFGDDIYSELTFDAGGSWTIDSTLRVGLSTGFYRVDIASWKTLFAVSISPGLYYEFTERIHFGSVIKHLIQKSPSLELPQKFLFAAEYESELFLLLLGLEKEAALPLEFGIGIITTPKSKWQFACGYRDASGTLSAGWRVRLAKYVVHYTWIGHAELPDSHGFGMEFHFK